MNKNMMVVTLGLTFLLGGCSSSEPDQDDVTKAVKDVFDKANEKNKSLPIGGMEVTLISARKISCAKTNDKNRYDCNVEVESKVPFLGNQKRITPTSFINDGGTWKVVE